MINTSYRIGVLRSRTQMKYGPEVGKDPGGVVVVDAAAVSMPH